MDRRIPVVAALVVATVVGTEVEAADAAGQPYRVVVTVPVAWWDHLPCRIPGPVEAACLAGRAATDAAHAVDNSAKAAGSIAKGGSDAAGTALKGADKLGQGLSAASGVANRALDGLGHLKDQIQQSQPRQPIVVPPGSHLVIRNSDGSTTVIGR